MIEERFQLAKERISQIPQETGIETPFRDYFIFVADFLQDITQRYEEMADRDWKAIPLILLQEENAKLYADIMPDNYEKSYGNPAFAVITLGRTFGSILSFLYVEMRSNIVFLYEQNLMEILIRMELFLEVYHAFYYAMEEDKKLPEYEEIQQILYWFMSDYAEEEMAIRMKSQLDPTDQFAVPIIKESDLEDLRYLYRFGEYIGENEIKMAEYLNRLSQETIDKMASTFTEGYRIGFVNAQKDLSKKKVVTIRYRLGFERIVKKAMVLFAEMGLQTTFCRAGVSAFHKRGIGKFGYYGGLPNKQYDYDHKEDGSLWLDKLFYNRKVEATRNNYERMKEWAYVFAGPAVMDVFGEVLFEPQNKPESNRLSAKQQKLLIEEDITCDQIVNEYMKGEERSFTMIAFPIPEIGDAFEAIFNETIQINTLDTALYDTIQNTLIDALDIAEYAEIKGSGANQTNLKVALQPLNDPLKETRFENCLADVNIPLGEVFTSPRLEGTNGVLHVSKVFLDELEYKNLVLHFTEGKVTSYQCSNFKVEEENQNYIKENVMFHHDTLPLGEFAIGTNTIAYVMARKYEIGDKLPILIAEKMGPHFAIGDTCYSMSEELKVYNKNQKEIIAKDNSVSILRKSDPNKAYFGCHTDISIPYDEIAYIKAVTKDGKSIMIIENGRFVLAGCEKLNEPFQKIVDEQNISLVN